MLPTATRRRSVTVLYPRSAVHCDQLSNLAPPRIARRLGARNIRTRRIAGSWDIPGSTRVVQGFGKVRVRRGANSAPGKRSTTNRYTSRAGTFSRRLRPSRCTYHLAQNCTFVAESAHGQPAGWVRHSVPEDHTQLLAAEPERNGFQVGKKRLHDPSRAKEIHGNNVVGNQHAPIDEIVSERVVHHATWEALTGVAHSHDAPRSPLLRTRLDRPRAAIGAPADRGSGADRAQVLPVSDIPWSPSGLYGISCPGGTFLALIQINFGFAPKREL